MTEPGVTDGAEPSCLIVANGDSPGQRFIQEQASAAVIVIATDGAAAKLLEAGIEPDYVIGDFDSIDGPVLERLPETSRVYVPDQDRCDLEKALAFALGRGFRRASVIGALGKRLDHTLTTLSLMIKFAARLDLRLLEPGTELIPVTGTTSVHGSVGDLLSLVALSPASGVTVTGVKWPLSEADMEPGSLGVSNVLTEPIARVSVRQGCVLVCRIARTDPPA